MQRVFKFPLSVLLILVLISTMMPVGFAAISGVSVTPSSTSINQGQDAVFSITVINDNKSTAEGTTFTLVNKSSDSINGTFSPTVLNLKKNQTGTVTLTIPTGSLGGSYSFEVQASAPALKRQAASAWTSASISLSVTPATNDLTPPVTNLTITSGTTGSDGWYKSDVGISLTATDSGGTGVKEVHYILNSGSEVRTDGNVVEVTIGTEGPNVFEYWAVDNAGNVEADKSLEIKIDKTLPVVQVSGKNEDGSSYSSGTTTNQNVQVTLVATDTHLASFKVDGIEKYVEGTSSDVTVWVTAEGTTTIAYAAVDLAGQTKSGTFTVVIDKTTPEPTGIHYVALGDSIATGSTSRGTTSSYVYGFYNHLKLKDSTATMNNLSRDGDKSSDLLRKLTDGTFAAEVTKASVITLTIGGNNIMDAARDSYFTSIDTVIAEAGTAAFEDEYDLIVQAIRGLNPTAEIIAVTLYNPYNAVKVTGYTNDPALRLQAEAYISRINEKITGVIDARYRVVDVHNYFKVNYADKGKMGDVTYFYPFYLWSIIRDPHPNQTGQNVITNLHKAAYPLQ